MSAEVAAAGVDIRAAAVAAAAVGEEGEEGEEGWASAGAGAWAAAWDCVAGAQQTFGGERAGWLAGRPAGWPGFAACTGGRRRHRRLAAAARTSGAAWAAAWGEGSGVGVVEVGAAAGARQLTVPHLGEAEVEEGAAGRRWLGEGAGGAVGETGSAGGGGWREGRCVLRSENP
jgi:hypothetical protein